MMHGAHMPVFGPKPPQADPQPATDDLNWELDEVQNLVAWECLMCLDLGFDLEQSMTLIALPNFTWHAADTLLKKGWPHATVVDELT